jgi:hypothetical protein
VIDYRAAMGIDAPLETIDAAGVWWQKPAPTAGPAAAGERSPAE